MRVTVLLMLAALLFAAACSGNSQSNTNRPVSQSARGYIVGLHAGATAADVSQLAGGLSHAPAHVYDRVFNGFAANMSASEAARLATDPRVAFVELDLPVSIFQGKGKPPGGGGGGGGGGSSQQTGWGVSRVGSNAGGGAGVTVAIFDTGIDLTHPDLAGAIVASYNATGGGSANDGNGHGTHVAGIVGARDNNIGYVGVAPKCNLVAIKVLGNNGSGSISNIVAGINWAVNYNASAAEDKKIRVGNMSLGASGTSTSLESAITSATNAGITFVVSAGNSGANAGNNIPAKYQNVICVSALSPGDLFASYSNWGSVVDMIAPGTNVPSLWKGGSYKTISGTSMSAPHVAGAAALWLDNNAGDFAQVKSALESAGAFHPDGTWPGDPDAFHEPLAQGAAL